MEEGEVTRLSRSIDRHGPGALTGTVTDVSNDPVEGVTVTLYHYKDDGIVFLASEVTDDTGTYDFGEVSSGTFDLKFTATYYETKWYPDATNADSGTIVIAPSTEGASPGTTATAVQLESGDASISGTVTDEVSEDPVKGATVTLYEDGGIVFVDSETTDADGMYTFGTIVFSGDYDLKFTATGYVTEWYDDAASAVAGSLPVGDNEDVEADAALTPEPDPGSISGTVTDDVSAAPISDVTVTLYTEAGSLMNSRTTAADGSVYIRHRRLRRLRPRVQRRRLCDRVVRRRRFGGRRGRSRSATTRMLWRTLL